MENYHLNSYAVIIKNSTRIICLICGFLFFKLGICQDLILEDKIVRNLSIGDWVLRKGNDTDSIIISLLGKSKFSHIGIISSLEPEIRIIHAITDQDIGRGSVFETTLQKFASPENSNITVIVRPLFLTTYQKKIIVEDIRLKVGLPFVLADKYKDHRYCTTLIADAVSKVEPSFVPLWTYLNIPFFSGEYLFPDAFINYPNVECIMQIESGKYSSRCN